MTQPRTLPTQKIPSRSARSKYIVQSRRSEFSIRGADTLKGYVQSLYPESDRATKDAMVASIERYLKTEAGQINGIPSPTMCVHLFDGLID